jgi:hypothetical protein
MLTLTLRSTGPRFFGALAALGVTALLGNAPSNAQTNISFSLVNTGPVSVNAVQFAPSLDGNVQSYNVYTTAYATTVAGQAAAVNTYCVDFAHSLAGGQPYSYDVSLVSLAQYNLGPTQTVTFNGQTVSRGDALGYLYSQHAAVAANSAEVSSALQLSLWKTAYDWNGDASSLALNSGNFRFEGNAASDQVLINTNSMLQGLSNWNGQAINGVAFYKVDYQAAGANAQALIGPGGGSAGSSGEVVSPTAIPEPGTLALLTIPGLGLVGQVIRRRRTRR